MLARQIAAGAPYDVFLSADERRVQELARQERLEGVTVYAVGRLGLWSKSGRYRTLADLASPSLRHLAIANPAHAPYGAAAREALERSGVWPQVKDRILYGENVRQALEYASSGNAEAAVVAWSLVLDRGGVLVAAELHAPIRQSGGVVNRSVHKEAAMAFQRFLVSAEGRALLGRCGFQAP